jgi:hypothetical protein
MVYVPLTTLALDTKYVPWYWPPIKACSRSLTAIAHRKFLCTAPDEKRDDNPCAVFSGSKATFCRPAVKSFSRSHGFHGWFSSHSSFPLCCFCFFFSFLLSRCFCTRDTDRLEELYLSTREAFALLPCSSCPSAIAFALL